LTGRHTAPIVLRYTMKNYLSKYSKLRGILVLGSSLQLLLGLVGCSDQPASTTTATTESGVESASVFLSTTVVPSDVRCLVLSVSAVGSTVTRSFDMTPSQATSLTATGLPIGSATLTEAAYNAACSQVTAQTPLTWVSDAAVVVQLGAGQTTSVSIVLRRAAGAVISTTFADNVDAGSPVNNPPVIATAASASPASVVGSTTALSVLGADDGGESNLTYTWATTGPASVSFSANGTNAAKNATASFTAAGTYSFQVTVKDQGNLTVASAVSVTVNQTLTSIVITPSSATVQASATQQFTATARDQFAANMASQPSFAWTVSGGGSVSTSGLFTAGTSAGGPFTLQAASGGINGAATVTVGSAPAPVAVYRIDTGSNSAVAPFAADTYATGGTQNAVTNTISTTGVTNAAPAAVYQSERYGNSTYTLPGLVASSQYTVRLHFAEIYWSATGKRLFNVLINGATVLSNFDIFATAGAQYKAVVRDFTATANASGQIVIQFNTVTDNATIEGIEVLSVSCPTSFAWDFDNPAGDQGWAFSGDDTLPAGKSPIGYSALIPYGGTYAFRFGFDGSSAGKATIRVPLCGGQPVDIANKKLDAYIYFSPDSGVSAVTGVVQLAYWDATGGRHDSIAQSKYGTAPGYQEFGLNSPISYYYSNASNLSATYFGFVFNASGWHGTIYIDSITLQ
jgi:hypothetical protein